MNKKEEKFSVFMKGNKKGDVLKVIIIWIGLLALFVYIAYPPFMSYMRYLSLKERCKELARFAKSYTVEEIKKEIFQKIEENNLPVIQDSVIVYYDGPEIVIWIGYTDTLIWLNGQIIKTLNHKVEVRRIPEAIKSF